MKTQDKQDGRVRMRDDHIRLADGRGATLSIVQFSDGSCKTMLLPNDGSGEEIISYQSPRISDAVFCFQAIKEKYHVPKLPGRYKKLADDLKAALAYGLAHMGSDDGGSCNLDSPTLALPGWNKKLVEDAASAAGVSCAEWEFGASYVFIFGGAGQGYTRTKAAEAMSRYLKERGYDAGMYYRMD